MVHDHVFMYHQRGESQGQGCSRGKYRGEKYREFHGDGTAFTVFGFPVKIVPRQRTAKHGTENRIPTV